MCSTDTQVLNCLVMLRLASILIVFVRAHACAAVCAGAFWGWDGMGLGWASRMAPQGAVQPSCGATQ